MQSRKYNRTYHFPFSKGTTSDDRIAEDWAYLETSLNNIFQRRKEDIPYAHLERMIRLLDMPLPTEAHEVAYLRNDKKA